VKPLIVFAHGAGAGHDHPWMQRWYLRLSDLGEVRRLTYPYIERGGRLPDKMPVLEAAHLEVASALAVSNPGRPLLLVGKSMGGRVSVRIADQLHATAVIALGYPLISSGRRKTVRDQALRDVRTPTLLVQGSRDKMTDLDRFLELVADHPTQALRLRMVEDGDHSLECRKRPLRKEGRTQDDVDAEIQFDIQRFVDAQLRPPE